jgi:hypothetical protein
MRKRLITPIPQDVPPFDESWLNIDGSAVVEVTSEDTEYPIVGTGFRTNTRLACCRFWCSNHPASLR